MRFLARTVVAPFFIAALAFPATTIRAQRTVKPPLHGKHWVAITGKPLGATAGAMMFQKGGNAVDATCAMLGAVATMWDTLAWGGETQALIYNPKTKKVIGINALGVAPTGATPEFYRQKGLRVSAGVRSAGGGHAGHARRVDGDARRVRHDVARGRARARRSRWPTGIRSRRRRPTPSSGRRQRSRSGPTRRPCSSRTPARRVKRRARARSSSRRTSPRRSASSSRPSSRRSRPARIARTRSTRPTTASIAGDIAQEFVRGSREQGGLSHDGGPRRLEGPRSRSR